MSIIGLRSLSVGKATELVAQRATACVVAALVLGGCGDDGHLGNPSDGLDSLDSELSPDLASTADLCDFLDQSHCMLPFPNDFYTVADASTDTGLRLNLTAAALPRSAFSDRPIDPTEWNRNDGFSPGAMIVTQVPGIDLAATGAPQLTDLSASLAPGAPVVLIDAATLERTLIWAELDHNHVSSPDRQSLNIRVAKSLAYGHRYIVALRDVKDAQAYPIEASAAFRIYRDNHRSGLSFVNARRAHMESLFGTLERAGISRASLYLAWDFTVASQRNLTGRLVAIRDAAFAALPDGVPRFTVTTVRDYTTAEDPRILRHIEGTLAVPSFLVTPDTRTDISPVIAALTPYFTTTAPLAVDALKRAYAGLGDQPLPLPRFHYASPTPGVNDVPTRDGDATTQVPFSCNIPRAAVNADGSVQPARLALYGHGLFGTAAEVNGDRVTAMSNEHDFVFCATDWTGLSANDLFTVSFQFLDLSNARVTFDTLQQSILNALLLGRAMLSPQGFGTNAAFQAGTPGRSVLDTSALYYDGDSQGGILGGVLMTVAQDITRGVLGVPGMNYSLLLERSADFPVLAAMLYAAYPDSLDQQFVFSLWQSLWDRADADGYIQALHNRPLAGTPPHEVLMHVAYGDHQVSMWSAEIEARTIGARLHCPALAPGRHPDAVPYVQLDCLDARDTGYHGSAIVVWDSGPARVPAPPHDNLPPTAGVDPHGDPSATAAARLQMSRFLQVDGTVVDVCDGRPCASTGVAAVAVW